MAKRISLLKPEEKIHRQQVLQMFMIFGSSFLSGIDVNIKIGHIETFQSLPSEKRKQYENYSNNIIWDRVSTGSD
jgi:hypothetical protein